LDNNAQEPIDTAAKIHSEEIVKEKTIDRQLEQLWANGRKQLLNEPFSQKNKPINK
jgi:hypothetical protein